MGPFNLNNLLDKILSTMPNKFDHGLVIYVIHFTDYTTNKIELWSYLSKDEKQRALGYYRTELIDKYIISRGFLRCLLSYYTQKHPTELRFVYNKYGRPSLNDQKVHFNLSHTKFLACYALSLNYKVGVDIEIHNYNLNIQELCNMTLTPAELEAFNKLDAPLIQSKLFYDLWTKKEALIKANGQGLFLAINTIEVINLLPGNKISINNEEWYYFPLDIHPTHSGAVMVSERISPLIIKM